jgi:hypothetical protein
VSTLGDPAEAPYQLAVLFLAVAVAVMLLAPRGLVSARTWVVGYLVVQFPVRGLFLLTAPKERPPIYAEFSPGVGLEHALVQALVQSLVGLALLAAAYLVALPRRRASAPPVVDVDLRSLRVYVLLLVAVLLLPLEAGTAGSSGTGGGFIVSLPGLMASGAAAAASYAFVQAPRQHLLPFLLALGYAGMRVVLLSSKLSLLACVVAIVISLTARSAHQHSRRSHAVRGLVVVLVAGLLAAYIFAVASGRDRNHGVVETLTEGAAAAVSRSYGADALMATNAHLDAGAQQLNGATFVEVAYSWVPRAVWPGKPKSFSIRFGEDVFSFSTGVGSEFFAPSYSGEWVLNFGTFGLLVGWLLFGLLLAWVDAMRSIAHRMLWLVPVVHLVEGSVVAQFWLAAPFLLGGYWVLRRVVWSDSERLDVISLHPVPAVEDVPRVGRDEVVVEAVMIGHEDDRVRGGQLGGGEVDPGDLPRDMLLDDVRVAGPDVRAKSEETVGDDGARGLPCVAGVSLVGQPQEQHPGAVDSGAPGVQTEHHPADDVVGHVVVDVVRQLDEPETLTQGAPHAPRQVARVDREAVATDPGAGGEGHEAERLGGGGVDGGPDVDPEIGGEHRELVDEGDVDVPEGVLEELGELGLARGRYGDGAGHQPVVELAHPFEGGVVDAGDDLGGVRQAPRGVPRIDALGAVAQEEVGAGTQPAAGLQDRADHLLGGAGVTGGLQHHQGTGPQVRGEGSGCGLDVGQVGGAVGERGRDGHDSSVEASTHGGAGGGDEPAGAQTLAEHLVADVLDVGPAGAQGIDPVVGDVVTGDHMTGLDGAHG